MSFENRLRAAHRELEAAGVRKFYFNPPLVRLLRKAGLKIPPPQYWSFRVRFLTLALWFGGVMGLYMWFFVSRQDNTSLAIIVIVSFVMGILFGLYMAVITPMILKKYHLSKWENLGS